MIQLDAIRENEIRIGISSHFFSFSYFYNMQRAFLAYSFLLFSFSSLYLLSTYLAEKKSRFGRFARDKSIILASRVANSLLFLSLLMLLLLLLLENRNWLAIVTRPSSKLNCTGCSFVDPIQNRHYLRYYKNSCVLELRIEILPFA